MIPLSDADRRPLHFPLATVLIVLINLLVFGLELLGGDAFIARWSVVPAQIMAGHGWVTVLTAMFMHEGIVHIAGNMLFLWSLVPRLRMWWALGAICSFICWADWWLHWHSP